MGRCTVPDTDVQKDGRMVLTAVFEDTLEGEATTAHRLVVTDFQDPSDYRVLRNAGDHVGEAYLGPEKRRIVFEKDARLIRDAGGRLALYDLERDEVRLLPDAPFTGTGGGNVVWEADGSGVYYNVGGGLAGIGPLVHYDFEKQKARFLAQRTRPYGLRGRTSLLVYNRRPVNKGRFPFYFFDGEIEEYTEHVRNEYLKIVEWEDESRGGHKYAAFTPAYRSETGLVAFWQKSNDETRLAITDVKGDCFGTYTNGEYQDDNLDWGPEGTVLFDRHDSSGTNWNSHRVMVLNAKTGTVRRLIDSEVIDEAVGLRLPNY